jgi:hypothetical protein
MERPQKEKKVSSGYTPPAGVWRAFEVELSNFTDNPCNAVMSYNVKDIRACRAIDGFMWAQACDGFAAIAV